MLEKLPETVGELLHARRAGLEQTAFYRLFSSSSLPKLEVRSTAFDDHRPLPICYTADGAGLSPPLEWHQTPSAATSIALLVEDADSPTPHPLVHAIVVGLDPRESSLIEGALDSPEHAGLDLHTGRNSFLTTAWLPPDPPPGHGVHRYVFQVFAMAEGSFSASPGREELLRAVEKGCVAAGYAIGTYERAVRTRVTATASSEEPVIAGPMAAPA